MGDHESSSPLAQQFTTVGGLLSDLANIPACISEILRVVRKILQNQEDEVAAIDDLRSAVADLQAEDGLIIQGLDDLAAKVAAGGTVTEADIQAVKDNVAAEVTRLQQALSTDDPSVVPPAPAPSPSTGP